MNIFTLQNSAEEISYGVLTKYQSDETESTEQDQQFENAMNNAKKKILYLNPQIKKLEKLETDIKKYEKILKNIGNDVDKFLDQNQEEFFVLFNNLINGEVEENKDALQIENDGYEEEYEEED